MANGSIQKYVDMITMQIATESFLDGAKTDLAIKSALSSGNTINSKLPETLLDQFFPDNELSRRFKIIAHREMTLKTDHPSQADWESGFSGTLFYDTKRSEYTFSIRSTEFSEPIHDAGDIYADLEIASRGWAFGQMYDMEEFWSYLAGSEYVSGSDGITTQDSASLTEFRSHMNTGGTINVTGYSLGGNLAQAFTELHPHQVAETYVFNSAGTGHAEIGLASVWSQFLTTFNDPASLQPYSGPTPLETLTGFVARSGLGNYTSLPTHANFYDTRYLHAVTEIADLVTGVDFPATVRRNPNSTSFTDIWASNGAGDTWFDTFVANSGVRHGKAQQVWHEEQPATYWGSLNSDAYPHASEVTGHSIVLLQDSLSLMALFEQIQPDITIEALGDIFELGSYNQYDSLERILNSLAHIVGIEPLESAQIQPADIAFADMTYRNAFHEKIYEIRSGSLFTALTDTDAAIAAVFTITDTSNIADLAHTDFSSFLSLYHLSPFTLITDQYDSLFELHNGNSDLLDSWQEDSLLTAGERAQGQQNFSDQFLDDRAFMLATLMPVSAENSAHGSLPELTKFTDLELNIGFDGDGAGHFPQPGNEQTQPPGIYDPDRIRISFGSSTGDTSGNIDLQTSENDDHLYGMGGADIISGLGGDDYIEGGDGNDELLGGDGIDTLRGGEGDDRITGGEDNDYLYGGVGADFFYWNNGDGTDTIADYDDGGDRVFVNGIDLATLNFQQVSSNSPFYSVPNQSALTAHFDGTRLSILAGTGSEAGQIELQQYNVITGADYGISLNGYSTPPLTATDVTVSSIGSGENEMDSEAWWRQYHNQGGIDWASSTIRFDATAVSNYSGTTGSPFFNGTPIQGGPQGDQLTGDNLNNVLHGFGGDDVIRGLDGYDILEGRLGSDSIDGGAGIDVIFGSTQINLAETIVVSDAARPFVVSQLADEPGDINILDGGGDRDLVVGGEYQDIISGGEGDDYLWGGTGEDSISGGSGIDRILGDSSMLYVYTQENGQITVLAHTAFADGSDNINQYDDLILGGEGTDVIWGELGNDEIHGDAGDDYLYGDRESSQTFEAAPFLPYQTSTTDLSNFLHGNDSLYGGAGDDTILGQGGDDLLSGGPGLDGLWGGEGDDAYLLEYGDGRDDILDNDGTHTLVFNGFDASAINVIFSGGAAYIGVNEDQFAISRDEWENTSIALNSRENLIERSQLDTYYLDNSGSLILYVAGQRGITEADRDQIVAVDDSNRELPILVLGQDAETFNAGDNDSDASISVSGSNPTFAVNITMAGAADSIDFDSIDLSLAPTVSVRVTTGSSNFPGTNNDDYIIGNDSDSGLYSGGGNDTLDGRGGMDSLYGQSGDDTLLGGDGNDVLDGGSGDDVLHGGAGNDRLHASLGTDLLSGGTGDDVLGSGSGYTYLFSTGDGNDVIEVDNAGGAYTKGTLEFSSGIDFDSISISIAGIEAIIHYGNGDTLTLDMSGVLTSADNAISRFTLTSTGDPTALPTITEGGPTNHVYGTFGSDHILAGNTGYVILPSYGDDIIETGVNNSQVRLNHLYFKDAEGGIGYKEIHMNGTYDRVTTPVHQGATYFVTSPDHFNVIEYDWTYPAVNPYDIELNGATDTAIFNAHGEDVLTFAEGIEYEDLSFTRAGQDLEIAMGQNTGEVRIKQFFVAYDVDISGQSIDIPLVAADTYIPELLTKDYVLAAMPKTPIATLRFASGIEYDLPTVLADQLLTVPTLPGATQIGTIRDDTIYGAASDDDVIQAREGHDVIEDDGGTNTIDAGAGDDTVTATGNNTVYAGSGNDIVYLSGGDNFVDGGEGNDIIELTNGNHQVQAGSGDDQITISGGSSVIDTGHGEDTATFIGGSHVLRFGLSQGLKFLDVAAESNASVFVEMAPGIKLQDVIFSSGRDGDGLEISIELKNSSSVLLSANFDLDTLQTMQGSAISEIHFADGTTFSELDILNLASTNQFELIYGFETSETLIGTTGRDKIYGFGGDDELHGDAEDDQLTGGGGNDLLLGGSGNDRFLVHGTSGGYDRIIGGAGFDTLQGGGLSDLFGFTQLAVSDGLERIEGGGGAFNIVGGDHEGNILDFSETELINILGIAGGAGNDTIIGTQASDLIVGQEGNDTITGSGGDDILQGNSGDDVFIFNGIDSGFDDVHGGAGLDTLRGGQDNDFISLSGLSPENSLEYIDGGGGLFNIVVSNDDDNILDFSATELINVLAIAGGAGNDTIIGTQETDRIVGQDGDDIITGGQGNDILQGNSGDDVFFVTGINSGFNNVHGGAGFDTLRGGHENDFIGLSGLTPDQGLERIDGGGGLFNIVGGNGENNTLDFSATQLINIIGVMGGGGHDQLIGSQGNDLLIGNEGNDTLTGSLGNDILTGSSGSDTYLFGLGDGHDTIRNQGTDSLAVDTLHLGDIAHDSLWLTRHGDNLILDYVGTEDQITVEDWYRTHDAQLDDIYTTGHVLQRNQVDQLVNAMASFDVPSGAGAIIPLDTRLQLEPVLTSVWQAA